jgi:hypothetical protein
MKTKIKTGRPTKRDPKLVEKLLSGLRTDFTREEACRYAGIHKATFYNWMKEDPVFIDEVERAEDYCLTVAKDKLLQGLRKGGFREAMEFVRHRQPKRYSTSTAVELSGEVKYKRLKDVPTADLERLLQEQEAK